MKKYDTIVVGGGGIRGIYALGFLQYFWEKGSIDSNVNLFAGSSVGSMICLLLACKFTPMEIFNKIYKMRDFFNIKDCHNIWNLFSNYGMISINTIGEELRKSIIQKIGFVPNLKQLKEDFNKTVISTSSNIDNFTLDCLCPDRDPELDSVEASLLSSNIPFVCGKKIYKGCHMVDGGLLNNCPVDVVDNGQRSVLAISLQLNNTGKVESLVDYVIKCISLPINTIQDLRLKSVSNKCDIFHLSAAENTLLEHTMSNEKKAEMFKIGYILAEINYIQGEFCVDLDSISREESVTNRWNYQEEDDGEDVYSDWSW